MTDLFVYLNTMLNSQQILSKYLLDKSIYKLVNQLFSLIRFLKYMDTNADVGINVNECSNMETAMKISMFTAKYTK
jgi:hypothetical protein